MVKATPELDLIFQTQTKHTGMFRIGDFFQLGQVSIRTCGCMMAVCSFCTKDETQDMIRYTFSYV